MNDLAILLWFPRNGFHVFPVHGIRDDGRCTCGKEECPNAGKHPYSAIVPNGLKDSTNDPATVLRWYRSVPGLNWGMRTGAISGVVVLDIDERHDGDLSLRDLQERYGRHTPSWAVITGGGGLHIYFAHPGTEVRNSAGTIGKGLDVRGENGYVLIPPSRHRSGNRYRWDSAGTPAHELAPMPGWMVARTVPPAPSRRYTPEDVTLPGEVGPIPEGQRNTTLASVAGRLRRQGASHHPPWQRGQLVGRGAG